MGKKQFIKIIVALVFIWLLLLGFLYVRSGTYLNHTIEVLNKQLDNRLSTEIHIRKDHIRISFLRSFPNITINFKDLVIKSAEPIRHADFSFTGTDTLLHSGSLSLTFDLRSILTKEYTLRKLVIDDGKIHILKDKQGNTNYEIFKPRAADSISRNVVVDLKKIALNNTKLVYADVKQKIRIHTYIKNSEITGSFSSDGFDLGIAMSTLGLSFEQSSYQLKHNGSDLWDLHLAKDGDKLLFKEANLRLMGIPLQGVGQYNISNNKYRAHLIANKASVKRIQKFIPESYRKYLYLRPVKGELSLKSIIAGQGSGNPSIQIAFQLRNATFHDSKSRSRIEQVLLNGKLTNGKYRSATTTKLTIDTVSCTSGESIASASGSIYNFKTPTITGNVQGNIDLSTLALFPKVAEKYKLSGRLKGTMALQGALPSFKITTRSLQGISVKGQLLVEDAVVQSVQNNFNALYLSGKLNMRNLADIELQRVALKTGKSVLEVSGEVTKIPFFVPAKNEMPEIRCIIKASELYVNDFIVDKTREGDVKLVLPDSVLLNANVRIDKFHYGKFSATDVYGRLKYESKELQISDFSMFSQGGSIKSQINIKQHTEKIVAHCTAKLRGVDINSLFTSFDNFGQDVITHNYLGGTVSGEVEVKASWNYLLEPVYSDLWIQSKIRIDKGELIQYPILMNLSDFIAVEELRHVKFNRLETEVKVVDKKVYIARTQINSSAVSLAAWGEHDFDNNYDYHFQIQLSDVLWKRAKKRKPANNEFGYVVDDGLGKTIIPLKIIGKDTVFKVSYDRQTAGSVFRRKVKEEKLELKRLITTKNHAEEKYKEQEYKTEWNEHKDDEKTDDVKDADQGTLSEEEEFQIIWDDE